MKILIVVATKKEIEPLISKMNSYEEFSQDFIICKYKDLRISFKTTGVGMVSTAINTTLALKYDNYDVVFNAGICGSFNRNLEIGNVVNVIEDCFSELGAEDGDDFLSLDDIGLHGVTKVSFADLQIQIENYRIDLLPKVNGITVNTAHGNEKNIDKIIQRFHPIVESMEGAAFMQACNEYRKPCYQIRAVSNFVEKRNKDAWNIQLAIENLNKKMLEIIDAI